MTLSLNRLQVQVVWCGGAGSSEFACVVWCAQVSQLSFRVERFNGNPGKASRAFPRRWGERYAESSLLGSSFQRLAKHGS